MTKKITAGRETGHGGGVLIFCSGTQRFLWIRRSEYGDEPGTWCVPGGGIEDYETIDEGVHRECREEVGFAERMKLQHMHRDNQENFVFHNHLAVVPEEFVPVLNEEHTDYVWSTEPPKPTHPRLSYAMKQWLERENATR